MPVKGEMIQFKLVRAQVTEGRMTTATVGEALNVQENIRLGLGPGSIAPLVTQFGFEGAEETFHRGIVQTVAKAAHAGPIVITAQDRLI